MLSPATYNSKVELLLACPIASKAKRYPFEVAIPDGLAVSGVVLSDHVKNLDWKARRAIFACRVPTAVTAEVVAKLKALLA